MYTGSCGDLGRSKLRTAPEVMTNLANIIHILKAMKPSIILVSTDDIDSNQLKQEIAHKVRSQILKGFWTS